MNKFFCIAFFFLWSCGEHKEVKTVQPELTDALTKDTVEDFNYPCMVDGKIPVKFKDADIVFIHSDSDLSSPISLATESNYTHCAVYWCMKGTGPAFYEAASKVEITGFDEFMKNRKGSLLLVMRLKNRDKVLDSLHLSMLGEKMSSWYERPYDGKFLWNDDELYCSELVYKAYEAADVKLCKLKKLSDFDLSSPVVKKELHERYGNDVPLLETIVAPVDLIYSKLLDTVYYTK